MTARARRRRGVVLLVLALVSGGLAASAVNDRVRSVERRVGPLVTVAVAARDLRAGKRLGPRDVSFARVPAAFVPRDALGAGAVPAGGRTAAPVAAGGYLTAGLLGDARVARAASLRPGERAVEVAVAGGPGLAAAAPGARVDVVVSTEPRDGAGRTFVAIEGAELLGLRSVGQGADPTAAGAEPTAVATLRVSSRQAVYLAAAQNFAREVRLLARPAGDRRRSRPRPVEADDL